ncbi:MAG: hypothetical protein HYZ85_04605 [Candidatus Omnitrophica bacterium]|nr:hypothetical protein [Candidatus Omnitrophota bacterium]
MKKIIFVSCLIFTCFVLIPNSFAGEAEASPVPENVIPISGNLTLELQGVSIFDVFKILSKKSGLNIVAGKNVQGQVSIFLQDVPIEEALRTILESQGLASVTEGNVIKVMTEEEYLLKTGRPYRDIRKTESFSLRFAKAEMLAGKLADVKSAMGRILTEPRTNSLVITDNPEILAEMKLMITEWDKPQETKVFSLRYAKVEDLEEKLKGMLEGGAGKVQVDKRANRIVVMDIPSRIEEVGKLVDALDVQVPQVLIEAKIVEVTLTDSFRQGIDWEYIIQEVGRFENIRAAAPLAVSPPASAAALTTFALGQSGEDFRVVLDLLERIGKTNTLSSPRVTVMNNEEAKLAVATKQPFVSQTVVQTTNSTNTADNVQFVDVGVTLKVLPRISNDDFVEMKIKPEVSSSSQTLELEGVAQGSNTAFTRTSIPIVTTQELETTVQVKSGVTIVIGGLIQDSQDKQSSKVPIIGSIPVFGRLFHSRSNDFTKTELVTFLTPTIIRPTEQSKEVSRFVDSKDQILPFEKFGEYSYRNTYVDPLRHAKVGELPYWEKTKHDSK